jgi:hypothetical protein
MKEGGEMERLERIAQMVDEEGEAPVEEKDRIALERLRKLRDAFRVGGPAKASAGFADRVLAMMEEAREAQKVVRLRARRDRMFVFAQAASLALLIGAYVTLLAATRVERVGERWSDNPATSNAGPDAGPAASLDQSAAPVLLAFDDIEPIAPPMVARGDLPPAMTGGAVRPAEPPLTLLPQRRTSG